MEAADRCPFPNRCGYARTVLTDPFGIGFTASPSISVVIHWVGPPYKANRTKCGGLWRPVK